MTEELKKPYIEKLTCVPYRISPRTEKKPWGEANIITLGERGRGRFQQEVHCTFGEKENPVHVGITYSKNGNPKIIAKPPTSTPTHYLACVGAGGTYTRGTDGCVRYYPGLIQECPITIAKGLGAYGDAGGIGSWDELLIAIPFGSIIKVYPAGGARKISRYLIHFKNSEIVRIDEADQETYFDSLDIIYDKELWTRL